MGDLSMKALKFLLLAVSAGFALSAAVADEAPQGLVLKDHKFSPSIIRVRANQPTIISLTNHDDTAEEFDSTALKVEKVVASGASGNIRLRPLAPGRYPFIGEFHSETAQGVVIAE